MNIHLADHYGVCFGVRDAIAAAERLAKTSPLTILGELVHNPVVRERLLAQGITEGSLDVAAGAPTPQVMVTAHGASDLARNQWRAAGYGVADGTCPLVHHAHDQLKLLVAQGCQPVVIGKRGHVEVNGLTGDFPHAIVIEDAADIATLPVCERYGVISQTTQPVEKVRALVEQIRSTIPAAEVVFKDTVCRPTKDRQVAMKKLLAQCDTILVVGGRNSNNTLALVAAAREANRAVYHIERPEELKAEWFQASREVGITAGTSTLKETVAVVHGKLMEIAASHRGGNAAAHSSSAQAAA